MLGALRGQFLYFVELQSHILTSSKFTRRSLPGLDARVNGVHKNGIRFLRHQDHQKLGVKILQDSSSFQFRVLK